MLPMIGRFLHLGFWPAHHGRHHVGADEAQSGAAGSDAADDLQLDADHLHLHAGGFPAGLVIYWAWNNTLSVLQQSAIMRQNGAKIELWDNLKATFVKPKPKTPAK